MTDHDRPQAIITWFYYDDLQSAATFYERMLGFSLVVDQGWARIYRASSGAHVGIVSGDKGSFRPQPQSAVLLTLVVDDVAEWHAYLHAHGAASLSDIQTHAEIQVRCFFLKDPGGYAIEIQQFLEPTVGDQFR
ncbi:MAG TPA: bleomycin resistance protein [Candidatus Acetothermia bacterium]|nr:bleomycin resistance protein [Candidatus Acetothermia bacterium]